MAEEESILDQATVSSHDVNDYYTPDPQAFINANFKSFIHSSTTSHSDGETQEFMIEFAESKILHSVFVNNYGSKTDLYRYRMGNSHLRLGNDASPYSTNNAIVRNNIVDTGFFKLDNLSTGKVLTIRRIGLAPFN